MFDRILMLLAGRKYNLSDLDDIHNHLTNTARAIELEDFNEELFVKVGLITMLIRARCYY